MHNLRIRNGLIWFAIVAILSAVFLVDFRASNDRGRLTTELAQLQSDLASAEDRLAAAEVALSDETSSRQTAEAELAAIVDELRLAGAAQYDSVVSAFADAADVACTGYEADATVGQDAAELARRAAECNANELSIIAGELASQPRVCGVVPLTSAEGLDLDDCVLLYAHSNEVLIDELAVTDWAGDGFEVVLNAPIPVSSGDTLDVSGYFRVTNDLGVNVGVAGHLWAYDLDGDRATQWRIGPATGDNVDGARHHMPITLDTVYTVPADWPEGHRMMVAMKADAHSTATNGFVTVDGNGNLIVRITRA
ncbi:MAG: hypothetical protein HKN91_12105 [Acidimicrobiia bacterium]|nr:hypothetical protein [Acidimicrobiia bacterium]